MRRNVTLRSPKLAENRADVRILDPSLEQPPCLHHLVSGIVDSRRRVIYRSNQRELVGVPGRAWKNLTDLNSVRIGLDRTVRAANFRRGIGLHVESVELAWTANQKQHDAIDVLFFGDGAERFQR